MDQQAARASLEQILRELDSAEQVLSDEEPDAGEEEVDGPHDEADEAVQLSDRAREDLVLAEAGDRRREVEAALARLDDGTYGTCVDCGQAVEPARLDYRPEAARCLADQEKLELASG